AHTAASPTAGAAAGEEMRRLYGGSPPSGVERAVQDRRGFPRVHLEPGETRQVAFEVPAASLAYWDVGAATWTIEPTSYVVRVGGSSRDLPLEATFSVSQEALP